MATTTKGPKVAKGTAVAKAAIKEIAQLAHEALSATVEPLVGPVMPAATTPAPIAAVAPAAAPEPAPASTAATMYSITAKAKLIAPHLTLQRGCTVPVGANWRNNGHKSTNTRAIVIETLAKLGGTFTYEQAVEALKPLKEQAFLGSGTPASYLRAFVKSGYLAQA